VKRREFITLIGGAAAWPLAARAQQMTRVYRVGWLFSSGEMSVQFSDPFQQRLREAGFVMARTFYLNVASGEASMSGCPR
jgi:putative tryptophan/tyrosine transport system substrate-binding protein